MHSLVLSPDERVSSLSYSERLPSSEHTPASIVDSCNSILQSMIDKVLNDSFEGKHGGKMSTYIFYHSQRGKNLK